MAYTHSTSKPPPPVQTPAGIDQFADVIGHTPAETGHLTPPECSIFGREWAFPQVCGAGAGPKRASLNPALLA